MDYENFDSLREVWYRFHKLEHELFKNPFAMKAVQRPTSFCFWLVVSIIACNFLFARIITDPVAQVYETFIYEVTEGDSTKTATISTVGLSVEEINFLKEEFFFDSTHFHLLENEGGFNVVQKSQKSETVGRRWLVPIKGTPLHDLKFTKQDTGLVNVTFLTTAIQDEHLVADPWHWWGIRIFVLVVAVLVLFVIIRLKRNVFLSSNLNEQKLNSSHVPQTWGSRDLPKP